jgi:CheY-like chemotaxis protein
MLGGSINLTSQVGVGSQFSVRLPRAFGVPGAWPVGAQSIEASANRPPRVLIIDDEALARYLVRKALAVIPAEVQEAQGAVEGMQFAREHKIDVIVLDLVMPDTTGFQLLTDLKSEPTTREIPIVIHTSLTLSDADRQALAQASAIVNKSQTEPQLREVVKSLVAGAR